MGEIFLARQEIAGVHRLVVLKRLLPELAEDPQQLAMFVDEARIAANLAHPGIVQVHEFGEDAQGHFIVMEYVPGMHVGRLVTRALRDSKPLAPPLGAFIVHEVARALDHAHNARDSAGVPLEIVHRDISPSNVLVSFAGDVKLMDFGIARAANRARQTNDGSIRGKFPYMSPEQVESKSIDARSDIFSTGVLLWEITLNRRLFTGETDYEIIRAVLEAPIPRPSSIDPSYPPALEAIVMSALERDRDRRLATAAELAAALKMMLREQRADRDDLAAVMRELFPDDAAESARFEQDHTTRASPIAHTAMLPDAPASETRPHRRWPFVFVGALAIAVVGGIGVRSWLASSPTSVRDAAVATPRGDVVRDAAIDQESVDATVDAAHVDARIDASPPTRPDAHRDASPDSAVALTKVPDVPVSTGELRFVLAPNESGSVYVDPHDGCTAHTIQTRCVLTVGSHRFTFRVSGGDEFAATLNVGAGVAKCMVAPSRKEVSCTAL